MVKQAAMAVAVGAVASAATVHADYASTMTALNPVGYWRLNETTQPPAGNVATNLGTLGSAALGFYLNNAAHPWPGAMTGSDAAAFSAGALVRVPYTASLNPAPPFSVEFWINPNSTAALSCPASSTDFGPTPRLGWLAYIDGASAQLGLGDGAVQFRVYHSGGAANANTPAGTIVAGSWHHVVCVADATTLRVYVNGTQVATTTYSGTFTPNLVQPFCFGTRYDTGFPLDGAMDEVALYPTALSASQVQANYNAATANPAGYRNLVLGLNPLSYWRLEEPYYVEPDPGTLPVAANSGTAGSAANGRYSVYSQPGTASAPYAGFGAGNYACGLNTGGMPTSIVLGNPPELNFTGPITLMAWIKPTATDGLRNIIAHGHRTDPNQELQLRINGGIYDVGSWEPGEGASSPAGMATADIGRWTFLVGTYADGLWSLYRNGSLIATNAGTRGSVTVDADWAIGARGTGTERYFAGTLDEVAVLTNALSAAQILGLYNAANVPPFFTQQPVAPVGNVYEGMTVTLSAQAGGVLPLAYQWTKNGANLSGKTATNLVLVNVTTGDSGNYAVVATNAYGAVTSSVVALNVQAGPPVVFTPPQSVTKYLGANPRFEIVAGGSVPLTYQWKFGVNVLPGQTTSVLQLSNVQASAAGTYTVTISNAYGGTDRSATLTLVQPDKYAAAVMAYGPRAYWRLNESSGTNALDWAGSYDGTTVGIVTNNVPSVQPPGYLGYETTNTGYQFSGARAYVETPALGFTNNTFTYAFWAKPLNPQVSGVPFMFTGAGTGGGCAVNLDNGDDLRYHFEDNSNTGWWVSTGLKIAWDTWNYIVLVVEPTQATFYLDKGDGNGLQTSVIAAAHRPVAFNLPNYISREGRDMRYFTGPMDEVAVFDRALSASDVASLHSIAISGPQPPVIVKAPVSATRYVGAAATFTVEAAGVPPLTYQWKSNGVPVAGATSASLTLVNVQLAQSGSAYSVTVNTPNGSVDSTTATLTVLALPTGYPGALLGYGPVAYWQLNEPNGGTTAYDYIGGFDGAYQGGLYAGVAGPQAPTFPGFSAGNLAAQFDGGSASILTSPALGLNTNTVTITCWVKRDGAQIDFAGLVFTRGASTSGLDMKTNGELRYHWNDAAASYDWSSGLIAPDGQWAFVALVVEPTKATMYMDDGTGLVSSVNNVTHANSTFGQVRLGIDPSARFFKGELDEAAVFARALSASEVAALSANGIYGTTTRPFFGLEPVSRTVVAGTPAAFTASASGSLPITYQWFKDGNPITGATDASLAINPAYFTDAGSYYARAANNVGSTNSTPATLSVMPVPSYANATNELVLHLKFDGNFNDASGKGHNGSTFSPPAFVAGKLGQAVECVTVANNTSTYVQVFDQNTYTVYPDLLFSSNVNFSVAYWAKFTGAPGDLPFIATANGSYGAQGLTFAPGYGTGTWSYYLGGFAGTGGNLASGYATQPINNGQWNLLVHSFDRTGNAVTYLNGVQVDSRSMTGVGDLDNPNYLTIGQDPSTFYAESATLQIDDVGIWRRALTAYEALGIYNAAQAGGSFDAVLPVKLYINYVDGNVDVSWQAGTLLQSNTANGPYTPVPGASAPFYRTTPAGAAKFYRVSN
jgi:hypothetical protein